MKDIKIILEKKESDCSSRSVGYFLHHYALDHKVQYATFTSLISAEDVIKLISEFTG